MTLPLGVESCGSCRFFQKSEGECRRNPPAAHLTMQPRALGGVDHVVLALRPPVPDTQWCGEWRAARGEN